MRGVEEEVGEGRGRQGGRQGEGDEVGRLRAGRGRGEGKRKGGHWADEWDDLERWYRYRGDEGQEGEVIYLVQDDDGIVIGGKGGDSHSTPPAAAALLLRMKLHSGPALRNQDGASVAVELKTALLRRTSASRKPPR